MSRARRGGSGARGGRGPAGTHRIAGVDIPVDSELQVNDRPQPTELFPVSPHSQILASQHVSDQWPERLANRSHGDWSNGFLGLASRTEPLSGSPNHKTETTKQR